MRHWLTALLTALLLFSAPGFADAQKRRSALPAPITGGR